MVSVSRPSQVWVKPTQSLLTLKEIFESVFNCAPQTFRWGKLLRA